MGSAMRRPVGISGLQAGEEVNTPRSIIVADKSQLIVDTRNALKRSSSNKIVRL
jgi:hypothetical protein